MIYIILVESDDIVRETLIHMIGACGHQVVGYPDAKSALDAMRGIVFDVLIAGIDSANDMVPSLLIDAKALQPGIRIVIGQSQADKVLPPRIADACLQVPFALDELQLAIQRALLDGLLRKRRSGI